MLPRRRRQPDRHDPSWVRYVVPVQEAPATPTRPVDVYAPPGEPYRAAICATIVAHLALSDTSR